MPFNQFIFQTSPHFVRFLEDLMRRVGAPSKYLEVYDASDDLLREE